MIFVESLPLMGEFIDVAYISNYIRLIISHILSNTIFNFSRYKIQRVNNSCKMRITIDV